MEILNNISPLPFYTSLQQQHHRKDYAFGQIYPLISEGRYLLPFQFIVHSLQKITILRIYLVDFSSGASEDITSDMQGQLTIESLGNDLYIFKYPATLPINAISHEGPYYLTIYLTIATGPNPLYSDILYSEVFIASNDISGYVKLDYANTYNLQMNQGHIDFNDDFRFKCYLNTEIGKPEYTFEEEATIRMGYPFVESQISKKTYRFVCIMPEYLCDALRVMRLCNSKRIFAPQGYYEPFSFSMNPKWEEQGDLASVECEFETDTIIQNIGNVLT